MKYLIIWNAIGNTAITLFLLYIYVKDKIKIKVFNRQIQVWRVLYKTHNSSCSKGLFKIGFGEWEM